MPLHDCPHTYEQLVTQVLPGYLQQLRTAMQRPWEMSWFAEKKAGASTLQRRLDLGADFAGAYVLIEYGQPVYVGIAKGVLKRLSQHVKGTSHYDASLAYRIARALHGPEGLQGLTRPQVMEVIKEHFGQARTRIGGMQVAAVPIANPLEKYIFEPFAAFELDTHQWNSFQTH